MRIGIVGGGPAGSLAASLFARAGHAVTLFERKPGREKACGGGFTARTLDACLLAESGVPSTCITELELRYNSRSVILPLHTPFRVYARAASDSYLLNQAVQAGAVLVPRGAGKPRRVGTGWEVQAGDREFRFDWLIGADGAASCVRTACAGSFALADLSMTFGYYLPGEYHAQRAVIQFLQPGFEGYLWSFPRTQHSSVGVIRTAGDGATKVLKQQVDDFVRQYYGVQPPGKEHIFGALVPTLRESTLRVNCCAGDDWALVGDAGGFVDAVTGEGIYFALRSAQLLGQLASKRSLAEFDHLWREDFGEELMRSAQVKERFYHSRPWCPSYAQMLLPLTRRSLTVRTIEEEFVAGRQGYRGLRRRALRQCPRIFLELLGWSRE